MSQPPVAIVAILVGNPAKAQAWSRALTAMGMQVRHALGSSAETPLLDVVLTDECPLEPQFQQHQGWKSAIEAADPPGVIGVGGQGPAEIVLPADATLREIGLACQLLAQVVRLRRQLHWHEQVRQRLTLQVMTDPLTSLPNRRAWDGVCEERLATACADRPCCVAMLDLDHFKPLNDAHGHLAGDRVLQTVATALRDAIRSSDFVARLGGDEFGLLLSLRNPTVAAAVLDRIRSRLPTALAEAGLPVLTASAGYSILPLERAGPSLPYTNDVLGAADQALKNAKHQGRNRTVGSCLP